MKRLLLTSSFLFLFTIGITGQQSLNTQTSKDGIKPTFASEQITVANTAIGFTAGTINPTVASGLTGASRATVASCTNSGAAIRILSSGTTPTTTLGLLVGDGQSFTVYGYTDIAAFRAIRIAGVSSVLDCQYGRVQ